MKCDICNKELEVEHGRIQIGIELKVMNTSYEYDEFITLFGKDSLNGCFCCLALGVGFKPIVPEITK